MKKVVAIIDREKCNPEKCQKECIKYDPLNRSKGKDVGFHINELINKAEIDEEVVIEAHKISAQRCPFAAIKIVRLPQELEEDPIHQFGLNQFRLFSLPIVKEKTVIGIIGRNGIGKSTSLQILAGTLKPNLGDFNEEPNEELIIQRYSTKILGSYFKNLFKNKTKLSYKPQRVELLTKIYKGKKLYELLKNIDEREKADYLIQELDMKDLKNRAIEELSGGELQRLAIIATIIKNADVYYFDEPTSFLDITHRIKVAKIIRELADENKSIVVVEHDLATLDYISDEIQIFYGEQAAYGIVSQTKSVRRGINEYLDGFLPEDNLRFRDYPIKFFGTTDINKILSEEIAFDFPQIEKKFESFKLSVNECKIKKGEVLAIMGANGLGKSTFLKLIAGLLEPDNTKLTKINLSYKPQYLDNNIELTVEEFLKDQAGSVYNSGWFKTNILEKLSLHNVINNKIKNLSGGELQKLHIAACLSKEDAELIAMDEPSAFIDVEDRLRTAEVIKEFASKREIPAIIVDHDIQFVDYLADSMLVFGGIPGKEGHVLGPLSKKDGMNVLLKDLDITYRKDAQTGRPRINKPGSQLDKEQRSKGAYYYHN